MRASRLLREVANDRRTQSRLDDIAQVARMHAKARQRMLDEAAEKQPDPEPADTWITHGTV